jgi:hypothetical protein
VVPMQAIDPARTVALPEAGDAPGIERAPDLASALRKAPDARHMHIIGDGLVARDRGATQGRTLDVAQPPLPPGISEIDVPDPLRPGQRFAIAGRVALPTRGVLTLLDPAGTAIDRTTSGPDGRFVLHTVAADSGPYLTTLQLDDDSGARIETLQVPVHVAAPARPRMLLLSGSPGAELKYLRRWAIDAGIELSSRVQLTERVALRRGEAGLDAATLQSLDVVIADDRAWFALASAERELLLDAVRGGLGLLLRLTADPDEDQRRALRALGFEVEVVDGSRGIEIDGAVDRSEATAPVTPAASSGSDVAATTSSASGTRATTGRPIPLTRRPLVVRSSDATPLVVASNGDPLGSWRPSAQGRIGLWWLSDSFRLVLGGADAVHGDLWSHAITTLARPHAAAAATFDTNAPRVGTRVSVCHIGNDTRATAPDGTTTPLLVDPASGCAAYWPTIDGHHRLHDDNDSTRWLHVRPHLDAPALAAAALQHATRRIAETGAGADPTPQQTIRGERTGHPAPPWLFLIAWLALFALAGWLERRR